MSPNIILFFSQILYFFYLVFVCECASELAIVKETCYFCTQKNYFRCVNISDDFWNVVIDNDSDLFFIRYIYCFNCINFIAITNFTIFGLQKYLRLMFVDAIVTSNWHWVKCIISKNQCTMRFPFLFLLMFFFNVFIVGNKFDQSIECFVLVLINLYWLTYKR